MLATLRRRQLGRLISISPFSTQPKTVRAPRIPKVAPITVTERAVSRIKEMIQDKDNVVGVKIGVKRSMLTRTLHFMFSPNLKVSSCSVLTHLFFSSFLGGCNGYSYTMNYANVEDVTSKKDEAVVTNDITVLVDPKATFYIAGTVMDYEVSQVHFLLVISPVLTYVFHNIPSYIFTGNGIISRIHIQKSKFERIMWMWRKF